MPKSQGKDDPSTPWYDARNLQGEFIREVDGTEVVADNAKANEAEEQARINGQWERAKRLGLIQQGLGLKKSYEHDGLNEKRPEGY